MSRFYAATAATSGGLLPTSTIVVNRSGSNPTFNFNSLVENQILVGTTYWCVYQGGNNNDLRLASSNSPDGTWTAYSGNPILTNTGTPGLYAPHLYVESGIYYLFYSVQPEADPVAGISYATASSVTGPYTKIGSYVLNKGSSGAWDDDRVGEPAILKSGSTYYMVYMGGRSPIETTEQVGIATASSITGPWTKSSANPIIERGGVGTWDHGVTADPEIFFVNGYYWIYYSGYAVTSSQTPWEAGLAYATDPVNGPWTKFSGNPIISDSGSGFDFNGAFRGAIYIDGSGYHLTYTGLPTGAPNLATMKGGNATLTFS